MLKIQKPLKMRAFTLFMALVISSSIMAQPLGAIVTAIAELQPTQLTDSGSKRVEAASSTPVNLALNKIPIAKKTADNSNAHISKDKGAALAVNGNKNLLDYFEFGEVTS